MATSSESFSSPSTSARSRQTVALQTADASALAKALRSQLATYAEAQGATANQVVPSHLALLNMLARAAGHRNYQALKAQPSPALVVRPSAATKAPTPTPAAVEPGTQPLSAGAAKALTQFDELGRLARWPHKFSVQRIAMWGLWLRFDSGRTYTEREVNDILKAWTTYGDHVTPRRELVEMGLLARKSDCSAYWKEPQRPSDEIRAVLQALRARR